MGYKNTSKNFWNAKSFAAQRRSFTFCAFRKVLVHDSAAEPDEVRTAEDVGFEGRLGQVSVENQSQMGKNQGIQWTGSESGSGHDLICLRDCLKWG